MNTATNTEELSKELKAISYLEYQKLVAASVERMIQEKYADQEPTAEEFEEVLSAVTTGLRKKYLILAFKEAERINPFSAADWFEVAKREAMGLVVKGAIVGAVAYAYGKVTSKKTASAEAMTETNPTNSENVDPFAEKTSYASPRPIRAAKSTNVSTLPNAQTH